MDKNGELLDHLGMKQCQISLEIGSHKMTLMKSKNTITLALFTLWTDIKMLKGPEEIFKQAFDNFMKGGDEVICKTEQAIDKFLQMQMKEFTELLTTSNTSTSALIAQRGKLRKVIQNQMLNQ